MRPIKFNRALSAPLLAEFLGTGILVMVALVLSQTTAVPYFIGTSVAATLGLIYVFFNNLSGSHFNPAITIGVWTARKISTLWGLGYIIAQVLGAVGAWQLYQYFTSQTLPAKTTPFATPSFIAEAVGAMILAMGLTAAFVKALDTLTSALTYATSFFVGILVAATASAAFLNPAIALAQRNINVVYVLGPIIGAIVGVNLYLWVFGPQPAKAAAKAATVKVLRRGRKAKK